MILLIVLLLNDQMSSSTGGDQSAWVYLLSVPQQKPANVKQNIQNPADEEAVRQH